MHPDWLSNAYLVADEEGGTAVFVDSGAPLQPLLDAVERLGVAPTDLLVTHAHGDHVAGNDELAGRFGIPVVAYGELRHGDVLEAGGVRIEALETPGHSSDMLSFLVDGEACFTGDTLFAGTVGGTRDAFQELRRSVMDVLMGLPGGTVVHPGHTDGTTIAREWEENPFVRIWRGLDEEGGERCRVGGEEATLVLWARDYDGGGKAWVRFPGGQDAIVGGSRVERLP